MVTPLFDLDAFGLVSLYMETEASNSGSAPEPTSDIGASLVEYGLLVALIAVIALGAVRYLGQNVSQSYSSSTSTISGAMS